MAKRKKRYAKKRRLAHKGGGSVGYCDKHHIFYQRKHYNKQLAELRNFSYCSVYIPKNSLHRLIHEALRDVPTPSVVNARDALAQLRALMKYGAISENDPIELRLTVLIALFDVAEERTTKALRKQLAVVRNFYNSPH